MGLPLRERLRRRVLPSLVVRLSRVRTPALALARLRARAGRPARLELYFAFDDPYAAIALPGLVNLLKRRRARLHLYPLLDRGIPDDPAAEARRRHALVDADRLLLREGRRLSRTAPLDPDSTAFLAVWTQAARHDPRVGTFAAAALDQLWLRDGAPVRSEDFVDLHRRMLGYEPAPAEVGPSLDALDANHRRLLAKGHWESPAAWLEGEWFFAHERLAAIDARLALLDGATP